MTYMDRLREELDECESVLDLAEVGNRPVDEIGSLLGGSLQQNLIMIRREFIIVSEHGDPASARHRQAHVKRLA